MKAYGKHPPLTTIRRLARLTFISNQTPMAWGSVCEISEGWLTLQTVPHCDGSTVLAAKNYQCCGRKFQACDASSVRWTVSAGMLRSAWECLNCPFNSHRSRMGLKTRPLYH